LPNIRFIIEPETDQRGRYHMGVASRLEKQKYSIREEEPLCTDAEILEINKIYVSLDDRHQEQLRSLIQFLAVSSDEREKEQYLDQFLKEI
jgi:hypothetical protein